MGSSTGLQGEHGFNIMASCCSFSVQFASFSSCVGGVVVGPIWLSLSWSCWKYSCYCTRSLWGLLSSLYLAAISLSRSSMLWVVGVVSRGAVSWGQAFPQHHCMWQFDPHILLACCEFCGISHNCGAWLWKTTVCSLGHMHVGPCLCWEWGKRKYLPGKGCTDHCDKLFECCHWILLAGHRWVLDPFTVQVSLTTPLWGVSSWQKCKSTIWSVPSVRYLVCRLP